MNDDALPTPAPRYPIWLGIASFGWVVAGWTLAALAPALAFVPGVEVFHLVLPSVTALLILGNLAFSLNALFRLKVRIDQLFLVTGLQFGLFTTLFFQLSAHLGAEHYWITQPTQSWEWIGFSLAHALRASDVLDTVEAFDWNIQVIKHRTALIASVVVAYHLVIDLFVLGLFWALIERVKKRLLEHPERARVIRRVGLGAFVLWLGVWLLCALWLRPWRPVDMPLWLGENVLRVVDFADGMESFDIHWHQVPKELPESTLTFFCRFWIAVALSLVLGWRTARGKVRPLVVQAEPPSFQRAARLGIAAVLIALLIGADLWVQSGNSRRIVELSALACEDDPDRADKALAAIRRLGPNAQNAIGPLVESPSLEPNRRVKMLETLGHLGPKAMNPLRDVALNGDASEAVIAVASLQRIGPKTAPTLVAVWGELRKERAKAAAAAALRHFGLEAMPHLMEATDPINSAVHFYWFNELDRNWTLRGTENRVVVALKKWQVANPWVSHGDDRRWIRESGSAAIPFLVKALAAKEKEIRLAAARELGGIGSSAGEAVPDLVKALTDKDEDIRRAAVEALGQIPPSEKESVPDLVKALAEKDWHVRKAAIVALGQLGPNAATAVSDLVYALSDKEGTLRDSIVEALGHLGPGAIPGLVNALVDREKSVREAAAKALTRIDPKWHKLDKACQAVPELIRALKDDEGNVRRTAAEVLGMIGPGAREAVPGLVKALADKNEPVREAAALALGQIGSSAREAISDLVKALTDKDGYVRKAVALALGRIDPRWNESDHARLAVPDLVKALTDSEWVVRNAAAETLGLLGPSARQAVSDVVKALADKDENVRISAALALGKIGSSAREALPGLEKVAQLDTNLVRHAAREAIKQILGK